MGGDEPGPGMQWWLGGSPGGAGGLRRWGDLSILGKAPWGDLGAERCSAKGTNRGNRSWRHNRLAPPREQNIELVINKFSNI